MNVIQKYASYTDQEWMGLIQECRISSLGDKD